ncbi:uncharacterized protein LOC121983991 [Zingiber officinale]|uniref:Uncharacterized protein n=1 Tax=Zingiber officinale TaxID=94328 RepID=A0A8J5GAX5_ZINOF|nr:uncharacterized protein LOC121983991 [Zingiber officinale]KAG6502666.1 hypothetical protein ZIOFF_034952 [Zingiber officinale]
MSVHFSSSRAQASLGAPLLHPLRRCRRLRCLAQVGGDSYLGMWKKAMDRERERQVEHSLEVRRRDGIEGVDPVPSLEDKTKLFNELLQVPAEERDRVQRLQVIDRAAAAIAAARSLIKEVPPPSTSEVRSTPDISDLSTQEVLQGGYSSLNKSDIKQNATPGPDFWSWSPPDSIRDLKSAKKTISKPYASNIVIEKEKPMDFLAIPLESTLLEGLHNPPLPPLQSLVMVDKVETETTENIKIAEEEKKLDNLFSNHAAEAAEALSNSNAASEFGVNPDGSKWWRETGIEQRPDGVVCKWTLTRGVSADEMIEWEDKFWEAADQYDYKELGSEKSGRDAFGNVWREYWKESMCQDMMSGLIHMEKTADKWGKNGKGDEWHEKWWEHYDTSGQTEKWAHKWCSIDPTTTLDAGHAHVWHERWGEKFDGKGGSVKYTDKWADRSEGDGRWSKWGDKWDEHFDANGHGVKQGETWWEGQHGERWNRTWGEGHNGSGWVHKYGKSSSGEHWDTHVQQETWYERHPHYGFEHCWENSVQLRAVCQPLVDAQ